MNTEYDGTFADMAGYCPQMSGGAKQRLTGDIEGGTLPLGSAPKCPPSDAVVFQRRSNAPSKATVTAAVTPPCFFVRLASASSAAGSRITHAICRPSHLQAHARRARICA